MDSEEFFDATDLPDVAVNTDEALVRTVRRGRARRRRRFTATGFVAAIATLGLAAGAVYLARGDEPTRVSTGQDTAATGHDPEATVPQNPEPGDPAVWTTDPEVPPSPADSTFTALVTRLGCNSGVTGQVLRPGVVASETEIVVTFTVETDTDGGRCPSNDWLPYRVDIGERLGERALVDGSCAPGKGAETTTLCSEDGGIRWEPDPTTVAKVEPHECASETGSATDVAHEPDWRRGADYLSWTDKAGCLLRIDVVAERAGPAHCGWEGARVLIVGEPLGTYYSDTSDAVEYVRDPDGVFGQQEFVTGFDPDAILPDEAVDSGFRRNDAAIWHVPDDPSAIWLVSPEGTERWPAGPSPPCL